ncbi:MAG: DUF3696 domain-containing protein [Anaerolineae bacterium]|nr:DUF3696 domain-containing protein [Anaerolineae bacterium]
MLTRLRLSRFKCWHELDLGLAPLTILFGTNSSGKTSILESLLLLKQTTASFDRQQHINFGGSERDYVDLGSYRSLVFNHQTDSRINITLEWMAGRESENGAVNQQDFNYTVRWRQLTDRVVIERLSYERNSGQMFFRMERQDNDRYKYEVPPRSKDTRGPNPHLPAPESCYAIPLEVSRLYTDFDPLEFNRQFEAVMKRIVYLGPLRDYPRRTYPWTGTSPQEIGRKGDNTVEALIASERRQPKSPKRNRELGLLEQVSLWLSRMELISDFRIEAIDEAKRFYETKVKTRPEGMDNTLIDVGFGISQVLPVITLLFFVPEHSIVLIEQPELHLHPSAQAHLADLFLEVAEKRHLQLVIESHSEHLLRRLQRRIAEADYPYANPNHVRLYYCEASESGSLLQAVNADMFGQIRNWPKNFFGDIRGDLEGMTRAALQVGLE